MHATLTGNEDKQTLKKVSKTLTHHTIVYLSSRIFNHFEDFFPISQSRRKPYFFGGYFEELFYAMYIKSGFNDGHIVFV